VLVVGAALVRGVTVLAGLRRDPVGWEFPGGKIEPGETPQRAIERECAEELGVRVTARAHLATAADERLELQLWLVELVTGEPHAGGDHTELRWVHQGELDELAWLDIDREFLPAVRELLSRPEDHRR
jgi:8-oxo-dGTP diphosphatase